MSAVKVEDGKQLKLTDSSAMTCDSKEEKHTFTHSTHDAKKQIPTMSHICVIKED